MTSQGHTPGPWVVTTGRYGSQDGHLYVRSGPGVQGEFVAHVHPRNGEITPETVAPDAVAGANARLIALAPELATMLDALTRWVVILNTIQPNEVMRADIAAAQELTRKVKSADPESKE